MSLHHLIVGIRHPLALATTVTLLMAGCGDSNDAFGKRYRVSGTVTYNGQPLERGVVSFIPEKGAGATGTVSNGAYTLSTGGNDDGALPGRYTVTVAAVEDNEEAAKAKYAKDHKKSEAEISPKLAQLSMAGKAKSLIPVGYGDSRTTPFSAEVKASSNTFNFDLTDKDAPAPPPQEAPTQGRRR